MEQLKQRIRNHKSISKIFYLVCFVFLYLVVANIYPLADDWYYHTSPHPQILFSDLLPAPSFWRPFDVLFGWLVGLCPALFPSLNRAFVVLAHIISVFSLKDILEQMNIKKAIINICVLYAMFSSGMIATIVSPDALNQSMSLMFGMLGMRLYLKNNKRSTYVIFAIMSVLWKESGIVWLYIIPFLGIMISVRNIKEIFLDKQARRKILKAAAFAILLSIAYFTLRFMLQGSVSLGDTSGRYNISLFSVSSIVNLARLFANAMMGIDTIALFVTPKNPVLFLFTVFLNMPFLFLILYGIIKIFKSKNGILGLFIVVIVAIVTTLPHIVISSAGEMHTYPTLFAVSIVFGYVLNYVDISRKKLLCCVLCVFISFAISGTHRLMSIYEYSQRSRVLAEKMSALYRDPTESLLIISVNETTGYSVFSQSAIYGCEYGECLKEKFNWRELPIHHFSVMNIEDAQIRADKKKGLYDKIWLIKNDEIFVIK